MKKYCYQCMFPIEIESATCPHCGHSPVVAALPHQLKSGTLLCGRYLVGKVLGPARGNQGVLPQGLVNSESWGVRYYYGYSKQ